MKPLPPRATSNTNSPTSNMMNIKLQTKSLITSVPTIQYILDPSNKKLQHAKRQEKAQSEETKQASKSDSNKMWILELLDREFEIIVINILRALMQDKGVMYQGKNQEA